MMDLLQYRLRDWAKLAELNECSVENIIAQAVTHGEKGNLTCSEQIDFAYKLADEIEDCFVYKACDADLKRWNIGDDCTCEGKKATVAGFDGEGNVFVYVMDDADYYLVNGEFIKRPEERTPIEKLRDEIASYAHSYVPDSVLDGWVKDLDAYIDQQGKDE